MKLMEFRNLSRILYETYLYAKINEAVMEKFNSTMASTMERGYVVDSGEIKESLKKQITN